LRLAAAYPAVFELDSSRMGLVDVGVVTVNSERTGP
jgi:hypothetical protein